MKKKYLLLLAIPLLLITGCKNKSQDVQKDIDKKYKNVDSYHLIGNLEILNNEDVFTYDVEVYFQKDDNYRVSLKNKSNSHEQIILKNKDGVFV